MIRRPPRSTLLSLHDALPILTDPQGAAVPNAKISLVSQGTGATRVTTSDTQGFYTFANVAPAEYLVRVERTKYRSEEHTSELQSQSNLVCRLLLEKKKSSTER